MKIHPKFRLNGYGFDNNELDLPQLALTGITSPSIDGLEIRAFLNSWLGNSDTLQITTSGSTGSPKTISVLKEHMFNSALATGQFLGLQPGDSALLCLSPNYIAGKMMLVRAMVLGLELDVVVPNGNVLENNEKKYRFAAMVPLQAEKALTQLNQIEILLIGGGSLSTRLWASLSELHTDIYETFGMTETVSHVALRKVILTNISSPFIALPHVTFEKDTRGCLVIHAPNVTNKSLITNDIVDIKSPTTFIWKGRYDYIINSGGVKINPEEIEQRLAPFINDPFFIGGIPNAQLGSQVTLFLEGKEKTRNWKQIFKNAGIEAYQKPKEIFYLDYFDYTSSQKIRRNTTISRFLNTR